MRRLTCTFALACLIASCAEKPPVAVPVAETKTKVEKNTTPEPTEPVALPPPGGKRVMVIDPNIVNRLPERREMQPTAPPVTADRGPNLMVPAPKPAPTPSE